MVYWWIPMVAGAVINRVQNATMKPQEVVHSGSGGSSGGMGAAGLPNLAPTQTMANPTQNMKMDNDTMLSKLLAQTQNPESPMATEESIRQRKSMNAPGYTTMDRAMAKSFNAYGPKSSSWWN